MKYINLDNIKAILTDEEFARISRNIPLHEPAVKMTFTTLARKMPLLWAIKLCAAAPEYSADWRKLAVWMVRSTPSRITDRDSCEVILKVAETFLDVVPKEGDTDLHRIRSTKGAMTAQTITARAASNLDPAVALLATYNTVIYCLKNSGYKPLEVKAHLKNLETEILRVFAS